MFRPHTAVANEERPYQISAGCQVRVAQSGMRSPHCSMTLENKRLSLRRTKTTSLARVKNIGCEGRYYNMGRTKDRALAIAGV